MSRMIRPGIRGSFALAVLLAMLAPAGARAGIVVTFSKAFAPATIGPGSVSTLTFTITNPDPATPLANLAFTDVLPAGVTIASPAQAVSQCGGTLSAPNGGTTISFSGGQLGTSASCTISVDVTSSTPGVHMNVSGTLTSDAGAHGTASADLTVDTSLPGFTKSFSPSSVAFGGRSTLTFTIDNSANASSVQNLDFTDVLPTGMVVASPANAATTCGTPTVPPTLTATAGSSSVTLDANGTLAFPALAAGATCTVTVDVIGGAVGPLGNTSGELLADFVTSGKAGAVLTVTGGATEPLLLTKQFTDDPVAPGGTVTLQFSVTNTDRSETATGIAFTDDLGAALAGLVATGLPASDVCGAGSQLGGTSTLSLTGGTLAAGASCTFSVTLQVPAGATPGAFTNTTSTVTGTVGAEAVTGSAASDVLFVVAFPVLTKTFTDDPVGAGGTVTLEFTITNSSPASAMSAISFVDELTDGSGGFPPDPTSGFLPFPVSVTLPPSPDPPCGVGSSLALISVDTDRQGLQLTGGSLAAAGSSGDSCTFSVTVDIPDGFPGGTYTNTTEAITATLGGSPVVGPPASDVIVITGAPRLTKEFTDDPTAPGGTATLVFTLEHDALASGDATAIAFSDNLAAALAGLTVGSVTSDTCGGTPGGVGTSTFTYSGGTLAPGASCAVTITVAVPAGALPGAYTNTTSDVTATVGGVAVTGTPASDDLRVAGLTLTKQFLGEPAIPGDTVTLRFTLDNTSGTAAASVIQVVDDLGSVLTGLAAVTPLPDVSACASGTLVTLGSDLVFSGGPLAAGASCSFDVPLQVPASAPAGDYLNVTGPLTATVGGTPLVLDPATDVLTVDDQLLSITKSFTDDPVAPGGTATLELTITNLDATRAASAITVTDDLDAALTGLAAIGLPANDVCGAGSQIAGTGLLTLTGGTLAGGASCTFSVTVQVPGAAAPGAYPNTTSDVTGTINTFPVSGPPATDTLVVAGVAFTKAFSGPVVAGSTVDLTFTLTNLDATTGVAQLAFADDLSVLFPGLVATGLPQSDVCGAGSQLAGTSFLTLTGGSLAASGSCVIPVTLTVPADAPGGTFPNTTSDLTSGGIPVAPPATDSLVVSQEADLSVTKLASVGQALAGGPLSYTIVITNNGPSTDPAASLTDAFPAALACTYTSVAAGGATGNTAAGAGNLAETLSLPPGSSVTYAVDCVIDPAFSGVLGNTATATSSVTDPDGANDSATAAVTVINQATEIPTASTAVLALLGLLLAAVALRTLRT